MDLILDRNQYEIVFFNNKYMNWNEEKKGNGSLHYFIVLRYLLRTLVTYKLLNLSVAVYNLPMNNALKRE